MGSQVPGDRDQDVATLVTIPPLLELPDPCLEHLIGVKASILAQKHMRQSGNQRFGRITQPEVTSHQARCRIYLLLTVESIEQCSADLFLRLRQVIEPVAVLSRYEAGGTFR